MERAYRTYDLGYGITEISEFGGPSVFLVEGTEAALLVDTGIGIGDLRSFVQSRTDKPLHVFLTHNHRDHVGNAPLFPSVMLSERDYRLGRIIRDFTSKESRLSFARRNCKEDGWSEDDVCDFSGFREPDVEFVSEGDTLSLGGRTLTFHACPVHTAGSMVAIDSLSGTLFAGDDCNNTVGITVRAVSSDEVVTIERALRSLEELDQLPFNHGRIFNGHADFRHCGEALSPDVLPSLIEGLRRILSRNYVSRQRFLENTGTYTDFAVFGDVEVQFNRSHIYEKK